MSFPFLFSLMFGDAGHGLLLALAAVAMISFEKRFMKQKSSNEVYFRVSSLVCCYCSSVTDLTVSCTLGGAAVRRRTCEKL